QREDRGRVAAGRGAKAGPGQRDRGQGAEGTRAEAGRPRKDPQRGSASASAGSSDARSRTDRIDSGSGPGTPAGSSATGRAATSAGARSDGQRFSRPEEVAVRRPGQGAGPVLRAGNRAAGSDQQRVEGAAQAGKEAGRG